MLSIRKSSSIGSHVDDPYNASNILLEGRLLLSMVERIRPIHFFVIRMLTHEEIIRHFLSAQDQVNGSVQKETPTIHGGDQHLILKYRIDRSSLNLKNIIKLPIGNS